MTPSFVGNLRTQGHRDLEAAHGEDFFDLRLHHFDTIQQCDGRTDRQTPRPWIRRVKHFAIVRKK